MFSRRLSKAAIASLASVNAPTTSTPSGPSNESGQPPVGRKTGTSAPTALKPSAEERAFGRALLLIAVREVSCAVRGERPFSAKQSAGGRVRAARGAAAHVVRARPSFAASLAWGVTSKGATARIGSGGWTAASPFRRFAALHIRISEPRALPELVTALHERVRYVVRQIAPDAVAVSVLGSFADGGEEDLKLFLAQWRSSRAGVDAEVVLDDLRAATVLPSPLR